MSSEILEKVALIERLIRLGATDIPNTPRMFMKQRSPEELAQLQASVTGFFKKIEDPLKGKVTDFAQKLPGERLGKVVEWAGHKAIENPEILPMQPLPVPGISEAWLLAKKGLEKGIDKAFPLQKTAESLPESAYSGGTSSGRFPMESSMPPFRVKPPQVFRSEIPEHVGHLKKAAVPTLQMASAAKSVGKLNGPNLGRLGSSIRQVAKPKGIGTEMVPVAATTKPTGAL